MARQGRAEVLERAARRPERRRSVAERRLINERHRPGLHHRKQRMVERSLLAVTPVAQNAMHEGTIVRTPVEYRDGDGFKTRPCVVVDVDRFDLVVHPITSSPNRSALGAIEIENWRSAGLTRPCGVRRDLVVVERRLVIECIGVLSDEDRALVEQAVTR